MLTLLSNIATKSEIEGSTHASYQFGQLYTPSPVINGRYESYVSIITADKPDLIQFSIWGILPEAYAEDWKEFQNIKATLTTNIDAVHPKHWLFDSFEKRRCLIVATGYFNVLLRDKNLYPYHVGPKNKEIMCFAGIYNILEDGFLSCSLLMEQAEEEELETKSFSTLTPVIIPPDKYHVWLQSTNTTYGILNKIKERESISRTWYTVSKDIFKRGKFNSGILKPVLYSQLYR